MKKWYLVEDCTTSRAEVYTEVLDEDKENAIGKAFYYWVFDLTRKDQNDRDEVFLAHAETDENGDIEWATVDEAIDIRSIAWYAVQKTPEDDWSNGSFDFDKAKQMLLAQGFGLIAKIVNNVCEKEIYYNDLF